MIFTVFVSIYVRAVGGRANIAFGRNRRFETAQFVTFKLIRHHNSTAYINTCTKFQLSSQNNSVVIAQNYKDQMLIKTTVTVFRNGSMD